jgi:hypothetical protein
VREILRKWWLCSIPRINTSRLENLPLKPGENRQPSSKSSSDSRGSRLYDRLLLFRRAPKYTPFLFCLEILIPPQTPPEGGFYCTTANPSRPWTQPPSAAVQRLRRCLSCLFIANLNLICFIRVYPSTNFFEVLSCLSI